MIMQPRNPYLENMRIQRQKGCLYVCGVKFETLIDKMRTSVNAGIIYYARMSRKLLKN